MKAQAIGLMALAMGLGAAGPGPPKPVYREIKDFVVACDNLRTCEVRWAPDFGGAAYLRISRDGGPTGALQVVLAELESGRSLKLDGRTVGRELHWRWDKDSAELAVEGDEALRLARALSEGSTLTYAEGGETAEVSLNGLKAALLAVDEAQGRLGTQGAFVRTGPAADAKVPAPPPEPVIIARRADPGLTVPPGFAARVRRAQAGTLVRNDCEDDRAEVDRAYPLNRTEVLVELGCMMHAYQSSMLLLRAPRDAPERAKLVVMPLAAGDEPVSPDGAGRYIEGSWDPETATFGEVTKGRGLADCGSSTVWAFDGTQFRLAEAQRMNRCAGRLGDWPTVFRAKIETR